MSTKKKRQDTLKAKEKKQRIIAAAGGLILVGLLVFQVPKVMKQMNRGKGGPAAVPQTVATSTTPTLEAPTTQQGQQSSTGSSGSGASGNAVSGLVTSSAGSATQGQLASFSRFESKDPFSQQVKAEGSSTSPSAGSSPSAGGSGSGGGTSGAASGSGSTSGGTQPAPGSAVISVNGKLMSVSVGTDFPQPSTAAPTATPLFHLVSLTATTAKISIAGGSYTSGAPTVTLRVNKPVTLMNTADGSRFKLILKAQGTPAPGDAGTTTTPTVTLPAPTP